MQRLTLDITVKMLFNNFHITILITFIINKYYQNERCLLIVTDSGFDYKGKIPCVRIIVNNNFLDYSLIFHYFGCQSIIIYANNVTSLFVNFETEIRQRMERFNNRKYLIVPRNPLQDFEKKFFELNELYFITDLLLVLPTKLKNVNKTESIDFDLKTHRYVGSSDHNEPILVDKWFAHNQSFLFNENLYPDKIHNQHGRQLKMATFTYEPYSVIGKSVESHHGSELMSAVQFAIKYNMTPIPVVNEKDYWGEIFPNWSGNGLLGNLVEDKADVGFSALYTWEICYHFLELSKPLVRTGITCLVPAPKLAQRWLTPIYSYSSHLWFCVILVLVVGVAALSFILFSYNRNKTLILKYPQKPKSPYFYFLTLAVSAILKPTLQQSLSWKKIPFELSSKFLLSVMLVLDLFLTSTYSSGLATVMTIPRYENAINTIEDLANSELDWGATQDAWITSIQNAEESNYVKIVSKFHPISEENLREYSKTGKFGFSIERLPFENYAIGDYIKEDIIGKFHVMEEDLYWEQCVIMLRKNSVLLPHLDIFILKIFEAGLISHWQNEAVNMYMDAKVQRVVKFYKHKRQEREVVKLQWSHVEGAFAILLFGYILSFVAFLLELLMSKERYRYLE